MNSFAGCHLYGFISSLEQYSNTDAEVSQSSSLMRSKAVQKLERQYETLVYAGFGYQHLSASFHVGAGPLFPHL